MVSMLHSWAGQEQNPVLIKERERRKRESGREREKKRESVRSAPVAATD